MLAVLILIVFSLQLAAAIPSPPLNWGILLYDGFTPLDVFGPVQFLNLLSSSYPIKLSMISHSLKAVHTDSVINQTILPSTSFKKVGELDVLLVPGGPGARTIVNDTELWPKYNEFILSQAPKVSYLISVCTGAALVAKTGIIDRRPTTTNKAAFAWVESQGPNVSWVPQARWVDDGDFLSSSGVSAGMDLAYYFISTRYNKTIADRIANIIEYQPHTNASWDPFACIWKVPGAVC